MSEQIECYGCTDPTAHTPADLGIEERIDAQPEQPVPTTPSASEIGEPQHIYLQELAQELRDLPDNYTVSEEARKLILVIADSMECDPD